MLIGQISRCLRLSSIHSYIPKKSTNLFNKCHMNLFTPNKLNSIRSHATKITKETPPRIVGYWLLGCAGMSFGAVVLGGVTRLTESGLSMVDWKLFGRRPPRNDEEWQAEFEKYRQSPEFKYKNSEITMDDFKFIWYMEYSHRMWGRLIGAVFYLPAAFFLMKGYFPTRAWKLRVGVMGVLLGCQGLLGWYMVKSGLDHKNFEGPSDVPRVSQYRLASHLSAAMVLYSFLLFNSLSILKPMGENLSSISISPSMIQKLSQFRRLAMTSKALVFLTAVSGAFVAGLDAGLVYNSFPDFAGKVIPDDLFAFQPGWKNIFENPTMVQFDHRILGTSTFLLITLMAIKSRKLHLTPEAKSAIISLTSMAYLQVGLGIATLLCYVPVSLAALHQSGALVTLSLSLWLSHEMKFVKFLKKIPK